MAFFLDVDLVSKFLGCYYLQGREPWSGAGCGSPRKGAQTNNRDSVQALALKVWPQEKLSRAQYGLPKAGPHLRGTSWSAYFTATV